MEEAERNRSAAPLGTDPIEVLQELLDGAVARLRYAQAKVDELPESEVFRDTLANGAIPNEWIRLRDKWADDLERFASNMTRNGFTERRIRMQEAQVALFAQSVQQAAIEAGIEPPKVRLLGAALRRIAAESVAVRDGVIDLVDAHALPESTS
jgi:hypothetical protein